jgi:rubrerythrin
MKTRTTISIDPDLVKQAQSKFINISELTEDALRDKLNKKEVEIDLSDEMLICHVCGKKGKREQAEELRHETNSKEPLDNPDKMTWLYPDERWICNRCLRIKVISSPVGHA